MQLRPYATEWQGLIFEGKRPNQKKGSHFPRVLVRVPPLLTLGRSRLVTRVYPPVLKEPAVLHVIAMRHTRGKWYW